MINAGNNSDASNGYEVIADQFIKNRQQSNIGIDVIRDWARALPAGASVLDLGCGFGQPVSEIFINSGFSLYGLDASPTLVSEFQKRFPGVPVSCATVMESDFFGKSFDAVIAIGLIFLLAEDEQKNLIKKVSSILNFNGRFLFTAPWQECSWNDILTGTASRSLGRETYLSLFNENGLRLVDEYTDEGENHYFDVIRN